MAYEIYARKYRPMVFEDLIGQNHVAQTLKNAIEKNRIAQAYIFSGMRGVGKTSTARILAKALNCHGGPTATPCNNCESCREINKDNSVDVLEIDGASNRGIDEVRSLREGIKYRPIRYRYKVIIIDEVHMLTREAFNALLKTLEEPPPHTVFILATTEFHKVPATIVSRCQHFEFRKISQKDIINHLLYITKRESITISSYGLSLIAEAADGSLRDAQSLLDQAVAFSGENVSDEDLREILGTIKREIMFQFSQAIVGQKPEEIFHLVEQLVDKGYDIRFFYRELVHHFRNLILIKSVKNPQDLLILNDEDMKHLKEEAGRTSTEDLLRYLLALQKEEQNLRLSSHPRIFLESVLVRLCHFKEITPLKEIIKEIEELKNKVADRSKFYSDSGFSDLSKKEKSESRLSYSNNLANKKQISEKISSGLPLQETNSVKQEEEQGKKKRDVDAVLKDANVQSFLNTFKAQILSIESKERLKKK